MQTWYSASTGLYSNQWWPSANVITMLADFQEYYPSQAKPTTDQVFPTTLAKAPGAGGFPGFVNGFYDDELWWVMAWIKVFDVTGNVTYLNTAASIFEDSKNVWGTATCGGLWWDKAHTQNGAVENELYLTAAAKLANPIKAYNWFVGTGLINGNNLINNGLDLTTCKNDGGIVFTYNQGILLSGLAELTWASGDNKYNELANTLATATIAAMTDSNGVLKEYCEPSSCNGDMEQFKGIFGRNIQFLYNRATVLPDATKALYKSFLIKNADSIWANDNVDNQLGLVWSGPHQTATVQTQSSALDAIVGAACVAL
ncbi:glycoside hydrolase [Halenospora varia]|nr:glycoside hydrolase [Halenospora varia]